MNLSPIIVCENCGKLFVNDYDKNIVETDDGWGCHQCRTSEFMADLQISIDMEIKLDDYENSFIVSGITEDGNIILKDKKTDSVFKLSYKNFL